MKRLFLFVLLLSMSIGAAAQKSPFHKGYRGDVSLGGSIGITKDVRNDAFSFSTTHGYSYGDGFFIGAGLGLNVLTSEGFTIPVYATAKYNFLDKELSPFVDCRIGGEALVQDGDTGLAFITSPGLGVDFRRFSFRAAYLCEVGRFTERAPVLPTQVTTLFKSHSFQITMGISF